MRRLALLKLFLFLIMGTLILSGNIYAKENIQTAKIKTSAMCKNCKTKLETGLKKLDGVINVKLNMKSAVATVKYDADKLNEDKLNKEVTDMGLAVGAKHDPENCSKDCKHKMNHKECKAMEKKTE